MRENELITAPDLMMDRVRGEADGIRGDVEDQDVATEELFVNMGPQHPSTHGVLRIILRSDGELILDAVPVIGYLHRCAEKVGEGVPAVQYIPYTDRLDYLAAMINNCAYAMPIEKLAGIEVPERGRYIRTIMSELNRIASHLVSFGAYGLDMGAFTPFLYAFREREYIVDLFEEVCGARLTYSYITVGGPRWDLPEGWIDRCRRFLDYFEPKIDEYNTLLSFNHIFVKRTSNVGVISTDDAIAWGLSGPCLRGSGVKWDLRRSAPYDIYDRFEFEVPVGVDGGHDEVPRGVVVGDSWNRYFVRILEMRQSVRIVRQALDQMPDGKIQGKVPRQLKLPADEIYHEIEGARGQLGFYIVTDGQTVPYRVKVRGPCFCNLSILRHICQDVLLADVPAIVGSIDVVMGEVDR